MELKEININTLEGRLLFAAVAKITSESHSDKTPEEVIGQLEELVNKLDIGGKLREQNDGK